MIIAILFHETQRALRFAVGAATMSAAIIMHAAAPDLIVHGGKIVTVDDRFSLAEAFAVTNGRIAAVGTSAELLARKGLQTILFDLKGQTVIPGLMDSHVHPEAAMTEWDHTIPEMETVADILSYVRARSGVVPAGQWIELRQIFITRLREPRYPTRAELDAAAPKHPVIFATGPDAVLNSLALKLSGITRETEITDGGPGKIEKDERGEPTGILRSCTRLVKVPAPARRPAESDTHRRTLELFRDYNAIGITSVADRSSSLAEAEWYARMRDRGELPVRMRVSVQLPTMGALSNIQETIQGIARHSLCRPDDMVRVIGVKTFLDGGMLTGSAYMREPWGRSEIYGITDPDYRGHLFIPRDRLLPIVRATIDAGLQFTAHSVGDGAVETLLDVYRELSDRHPVRRVRACITHCNFMTAEAVRTAAQLGVVIDMQPAWLYLDARTLIRHFGYERLRYFQPLRSLFAAGAIVGGGSDHMQKIGALRAINPYHPFLAMWIATTRQARWHEGKVHPEEAISREQALRMYTRNNAHLLFLEDLAGSLEPGKYADFAVLDRDLLTCSDDDLRTTRVLRTYLAGKMVYPGAND